MLKIFKRIRNQFDKEMRAYYKMHRKHRKELIKLAKEDREWDWSYFHTIVMTKIKHMYNYYSAGNNVWQSEESLNTVLSTLKEVIDLDEEWDNLWDNCYDENNARASVLKYREREEEIVKELYKKVGENMMWWWD